MPSRYLRRSSPDRLKPCSERMVDVCDIETADGCCGVIPCKLCLEWETYNDGIAYGSAEFGGSSWTGTVGGHSFVSYWERNYESGECEYIVTLDDEEVYRATCYEGASCRNPSGEVAVSTAYLEGTLRWSKHEPRELALIDNPDTGCRDFFCGTCRCSCECLCVTITSPYGLADRGEICDVAYDCDPPLWSGSVGGYSLEIALGRDQYGECIITPTVDGVELDAVSVAGCDDMSANFTLADGSVVVVRCKQCSCELGECVVGCCWPITYDDPLYPGGALADMPFDLDGCAAATLSGTFRPFEPGTLTSGSCGPCGSYRGDWAGVVVGTLKIESGENCMDTPCSVAICLVLECVTDDEDNGLEECCSHMRLWVGATEPLVGADPDGPPAELVIGGCDSWLKITPTTCACDGQNGVSAVFDISLALVRDNYTTGPCAGQPIGCQITCQTLQLTI